MYLLIYSYADKQLNLSSSPLKRHQAKNPIIDHELYSRLCDLLYKPDSDGVESDSADEVFSPATDMESERENWECLKAFDNFSGVKSETDHLSSDVSPSLRL